MVLLSGLTTIHEAPAVFWGPSRQRVIHKLELIVSVFTISIAGTIFPDSVVIEGTMIGNGTLLKPCE